MNPPHPEDLDRLYQSATPADPSEAQWAGMLDRIERQVERQTVVVHPLARSRFWWSLAGALGGAAAIILLFWRLHTMSDMPENARRPSAPPVQVEPFPVASAEDVEIISVDAAASASVVVGELPLRKPIVLMEPGDVAFRSVERNPNGEWVQVDGGAESPMIWAPLAAGPGKN